MREKIFVLLLVCLVFSTCQLVTPVKSTSADDSSAENSWASRAPMHVARSNLAVANVNGKIYAIGGSTVSYFSQSTSETIGEIVGTNEEYSPTTNTWIYKKLMPTPRVSLSAVVCQNKIYCVGGESNGEYLGTNEVYDPATDSWETKAPNANC